MFYPESRKEEVIDKIDCVITFFLFDDVKIFSLNSLKNTLVRFGLWLRGDEVSKSNQKILDILSITIITQFFKKFGIDWSYYNSLLVKCECEPITGDFAASTVYSTGLNMGISANANVTKIKNHVKQASDIVYQTSHPIIDNFVYYSQLLKLLKPKFQTFDTFKKIQYSILTEYLIKMENQIRAIERSEDSTIFNIAGQRVFKDYLSALYSSNRASSFNFKFVPFLVELNGIPGIGKSTIIHAIVDSLYPVLPFFNQRNLLYTRVNDKFWNGYNGQPFVLFDDPNQNARLLYDLDNEIIQMGSGQFVHPPMAFTKDTKFTSLIVFFSTNDLLVQTTRANKQAISRRISTFKCVPRENSGSITNSQYGPVYKYHYYVPQSPFNLLLNKESYLTVILKFLHNITNQLTHSLHILNNPFWFVENVTHVDFSCNYVEEITEFVTYCNSLNFKYQSPADIMDDLLDEIVQEEMVAVKMEVTKELIIERFQTEIASFLKDPDVTSTEIDPPTKLSSAIFKALDNTTTLSTFSKEIAKNTNYTLELKYFHTLDVKCFVTYVTLPNSKPTIISFMTLDITNGRASHHYSPKWTANKRMFFELTRTYCSSYSKGF